MGAPFFCPFFAPFFFLSEKLPYYWPFFSISCPFTKVCSYEIAKLWKRNKNQIFIVNALPTISPKLKHIFTLFLRKNRSYSSISSHAPAPAPAPGGCTRGRTWGPPRAPAIATTGTTSPSGPSEQRAGSSDLWFCVTHNYWDFEMYIVLQ